MTPSIFRRLQGRPGLCRWRPWRPQWRGGAQCLVLCDTNGGTLTSELAASSRRYKRRSAGFPLGIHAHNDSELAVANTLAAVELGCQQVQGTINGFGERCGNANLCSIIPALQLKMGIRLP